MKENTLLLPSPVWFAHLTSGCLQKSHDFPARASTIACTGGKRHCPGLRKYTPRLRVPVLPYLGATDSRQAPISKFQESGRCWVLEPYWEVPCEGDTLGCPGVLEVLSPSILSPPPPPPPGQVPSLYPGNCSSSTLGTLENSAQCSCILSRTEGLVAVITGDLTHR